MGHKLYAVIRRYDYQLYTNIISRIVENSDVNNFCKQSFWKPNIVMSHHNKIYVLLLSQIGACQSINENHLYNKMYRFFYIVYFILV